MKEIRKNAPALLVLFLVLGFAQGAFTQADPPEWVARLNFIEGAVSYLPSGGDENDWVTAVMNRPLTAGDQLWADANSRGELHISGIPRARSSRIKRATQLRKNDLVKQT